MHCKDESVMIVIVRESDMFLCMILYIYILIVLIVYLLYMLHQQ